MDVLLLLALPVFVLSMWIEHRIAQRRSLSLYDRGDTTASVLMGFGSLAVGVPFKLMFLWMLTLLYEHRLFDLGTGPLVWVALLFAEDLCYYWSHRMNHEVRMLWAGHVNHHSSERYHLATAVRQSWTQPYMMWIFWLPLPLLGFHPLMIVTQQAISLIYQFFIHTTLVKKLGPLEWFMNTPSHHRVHHAVNVRYLDRNHGGIFILWDRLFGTFVEEREDDPPVYGITKNIETFNPLRIAFHEWANMLRDARRARGLVNKLRYIFSPPGWSPDGSTQTAAQMRAAFNPDLLGRPGDRARASGLSSTS